MSRRSRARHSQIAAVVVVGNGRTGAIGTRAVGIGGRIVPRCVRADAGAVAGGDLEEAPQAHRQVAIHARAGLERYDFAVRRLPLIFALK